MIIELNLKLLEVNWLEIKKLDDETKRQCDISKRNTHYFYFLGIFVSFFYTIVSPKYVPSHSIKTMTFFYFYTHTNFKIPKYFIYSSYDMKCSISILYKY